MSEHRHAWALASRGRRYLTFRCATCGAFCGGLLSYLPPELSRALENVGTGTRPASG
ncbi:MAG TPA: hypothetical protein VHF24_12015 [Acidimicrobiales bacterium]|nr:hypothetical protein [Acidimicrobiales bacterium]